MLDIEINALWRGSLYDMNNIGKYLRLDHFFKKTITSLVSGFNVDQQLKKTISHIVSLLWQVWLNLFQESFFSSLLLRSFKHFGCKSDSWAFLYLIFVAGILIYFDYVIDTTNNLVDKNATLGLSLVKRHNSWPTYIGRVHIFKDRLAIYPFWCRSKHKNIYSED